MSECKHLHIEGWRVSLHMGGCQNYGPSLGTLNIRCRTIIGAQKGTIILITAHIILTKAVGVTRLLLLRNPKCQAKARCEGSSQNQVVYGVPKEPEAASREENRFVRLGIGRAM